MKTRVCSVTRSLALPAFALLISTLPSSSQNSIKPIDASTLTPFASGLQGPRGLAFGPDGMLYVAEGGLGGTTSTISDKNCQQVPAPIGPYSGGPTARISRINPRDRNPTVEPFATGLPSAVDSNQPVHDIAGVADVAFLNGELYAILAGGGCSHGNPKQPNGIVKIEKNGKWNYITNLSTFYADHPAAYTFAPDFEIDGEPYSLIAYDGNLYSVEANHGQLVRTTPQGFNTVITDFSAHLGHIVPTALAEANGNFYVSNLGQFPVTPEWEKLMTISRNLLFFDFTPGLTTRPSDIGSFQLAAVRAGLTAVLGLKFGPDGLLYALEFSTAADYPTPGTGKVVRLKRDGTFEDVVTGLTVPTGMTFGPDHALYISNFGAAPPGAGQILRVNIPM